MPEGKQKSRRITTLSTLAVAAILLLGGLYLANVSSRLAYQRQRNFRIAATLAEITEKKIHNVAKIVQIEAGGAAEASDRSLPEGYGGLFAALANMIDPVISATAEVLRIPVEALRPQPTHDTYKRLDHLPCFHHVHWHPGDNEHGRSTIEPKITDLAFRQKERGGGTLHLEARIDCFFDYLERPGVFDDVAIVSSKGGVLFQADTSITRLRELSPKRSAQESTSKGKEKDAGATAALLGGLSRLQEVELAGDRYALFRQPLRLDLLLEGDSEPLKWELVGLVRSDRLLAEALQIDPAYLASFVAVFLLVLCAWPLFKLWATGPRERLHPREVRRVSLTLVVGSALLAIFALDIGLHGRQHKKLDTDLEATARLIQNALETEIGDAMTQLRSLNALRSDPVMARSYGLQRCEATGGLFQRTEAVWGEEGTYPHLEMVFWTAADGGQLEKWAVGEPTPMIDLQDREYFQRAYSRELWAPDRWGKNEPPPTDFFVQPIRSWTTGEQEVVLSVPYRDRPCQPGNAEEKDPVAAMTVIRLPSMLRPILPPGRGFAVVDRHGQVVFHSEPERNGVENFLEECEGAPELQGALFSHTSRHFTSRYRGRERVMFSRPLAGLPWHLVVFEDKTLHETVSLEAMEAAVLLSLFQILLLVLGLLVIRGVGGRGTLRSLWPAPDDFATYTRMTSILLLMAAGLLLSLLLLGSPRALVAAGLLLPLAALGFTVAATTRPEGGSRRKHRAGLGVGLAASVLLLALEAGELAAATSSWLDGAVWVLHLGLLAMAATGAWIGRSFSRLRTVWCRLRTWRFLRVLKTWNPFKDWRPTRALRSSPTVLFVAAGLVLLTVMSALPATTFLQAGYRERVILEVRRGQMHLARELVRRHQRVADEHRDSDNPHLRRAALDDHGDVHYGGYFGTSLDVEQRAESEEPPPENLFTMRPFSGLPFLNPHSVKARGAVGRGAEDWERTAASDSLVLAGGPPTGGPEVTISSQVPSIVPASGATTFLAVVLFAAGVAAALVFVGRRVFHIDFRLRRPSSLSELQQMYYTRLLVVVPPDTETGDTFEPSALSVDLARCGTPGGDEELDKLEKKLPAEGLVRIDHLEGALDDAASREKTLPLFEAALSRSGEDARVVVFCHRDPRAELEAAEDRLQEDSDPKHRKTLQRWREMLDRFAEEWVPDPGDPERFAQEVSRAGLSREQRATLIRECRGNRILQETGRRLLRRSTVASRDAVDIVQRIAQEADDHYRALWRALATEERHVLAQLACGCLVNRGLRRPLDRLLRWNLLVRELSTFRVMNESFRRFVVSHHDREALHEWEEAAAVGVWRRVRVPFFAALAAVALFLLVTQRDLFNVTLAFASAAAASLPAALKLFGWIRRAREG